MNTKSKHTKESLMLLFQKLLQKNGCVPSKKLWTQDLDTPSDMPIRILFGGWNKFLIANGEKPYNPNFNSEARINSIKARRNKIGANNKGGRIVDKFGYVQIWMPEHPNAKMAGYIHEHRLVMSNYINRPLYQFENVHHKNGIRHDNRIENLELWDKTQPSGQRVQDKIEWCIEFLKRNGIEVI